MYFKYYTWWYFVQFCLFYTSWVFFTHKRRWRLRRLSSLTMSLSESSLLTSKSRAPVVIIASVRPALVWAREERRLQASTTTFSSLDSILDTSREMPWAVRGTWSRSTITLARTTTWRQFTNKVYAVRVKVFSKAKNKVVLTTYLRWAIFNSCF